MTMFNDTQRAELKSISNRETFEAAAARLRPKFAAVPVKDLLYVLDDHLSASTVVINAEARYMRFRGVMEPHGGAIDLALIDDCAPLARAYIYLNSLLKQQRQVPSFDKRAVHAEGVKVRALLGTVRSGLSQASVAEGENLRPLTGTAGNANVARDLIAHVGFFNTVWDKVQGQVPIDRDDLDWAQRIADALITEGDPGEPLEPGSPQLEMYQCGTLLIRAYSQVRRMITMLRWEEGDADKIAPPFYSNRAQGSKAAEEPEAPAEEPSVPAQPAAAVEPATPAAPVPVGFKGSSPFTS